MIPSIFYFPSPLGSTKRITNKEATPKSTTLSVEQIESIEFMDAAFGAMPYHLKKVKIKHPNQNVTGYTIINGVYYKKTYK